MVAFLLLCSGVAFAIWSWREPLAGCEYALHYRIGDVDTRFGMSATAFREVTERAVHEWERASGRNLFTYDPTADFTINLVFDERQRDTIAGQQLSRQLKHTEVSHNNIQSQQERWQIIFDTRLQSYEQKREVFRERLDAHNASVNYWNENGGVPRETFETMHAERADLDEMKTDLEGMRLELEELRDRLASLNIQSASLIEHYNQSARSYNSLQGVNSPFNKGEYDGEKITIYQFQDKADLTLVLAHELGHAIGLNHIDAPEAIMHALMGAQDKTNPTPTHADIEALRNICGEQL